MTDDTASRSPTSRMLESLMEQMGEALPKLSTIDSKMDTLAAEVMTLRQSRHAITNQLQLHELKLSQQGGRLDVLDERGRGMDARLDSVLKGVQDIKYTLDHPDQSLYLTIAEVLQVRQWIDDEKQENTDERRISAEGFRDFRVLGAITVLGLVANIGISHHWFGL